MTLVLVVHSQIAVSFNSIGICKFLISNHIVLISFVFVIGPTERAVLASYTMVILECLHDQCIGANSQSKLVIPNWFYNWFSLYTVPHAHS